MKSFRSFDLYRHVPKDLTEQTTTGAIVSLFCTVLVGWLFISEFNNFLTPEIGHEMLVDRPREGESDLLKINLKIDVPNVPCVVVSLDAQDVMGNHKVDIGGELRKTRLDSEGFVKTDVYGKKMPDVRDDDSDQYAKEQKGEGCRLHGFVQVKKVPGNIHISAHSKPAVLKALFGAATNINMSHAIHDLWFGDSEELHAVEKAAVNPLRSTQMTSHGSADQQSPVSYEYYIKIVPTSYLKLDGHMSHNYQFVANRNSVNGRYRLPAVYFRYDLSPVMVQFTQTDKKLSHFLVQVCAIVGGVFTALGLFNSLIHSSLKAVLAKKQDLGKLG